MSISPRPWIVGTSMDGPWPVYRLRDMNDPSSEEEIQANRRLIEAAPELLARVVVHLEIQNRIDRREIGSTFDPFDHGCGFCGPCVKRHQEEGLAIAQAIHDLGIEQATSRTAGRSSDSG